MTQHKHSFFVYNIVVECEQYRSLYPTNAIYGGNYLTVKTFLSYCTVKVTIRKELCEQYSCSVFTKMLQSVFNLLFGLP